MSLDFWRDVLNFLRSLMQPGNRPYLVVFTVVLVALAAFVAFWVVAYFKKEKLDLAHRFFGVFWIHVKGGPNDPRVQPRTYRKLLYVKVNYLSNQKIAAAPFYVRTVGRLDGQDQQVPVYDEAVYTTLRLFSEKRAVTPEQDQSSGVVDPRLVIPWQSRLEFHNEGARRVKQLVDIEAREDSDTMLSVSHFLNGLQSGEQDFSTYADEDAESLRMVVDFSSIPHARDLIALDQVKLLVSGQPLDTDDLKYQQCGESVYMAHCRNAKKGSLMQMSFTFKNWDGAAAGPRLGGG